MSFIEVLLIAVSLSMDAFAVAVCKGLAMKKCTWEKAITVGIYFGIFQAGMPLIGYFLGRQFRDFVESVDHWIAFVLLAIIGIGMIKEALSPGEECENCGDASLDVKTMLGLAVATSIDALAVGVAFSMQDVNIIPSGCVIGITTFVLSVGGVKIGNQFGGKYHNRAEFVGGLVLVLMGLKILLEDLGIIAF